MLLHAKLVQEPVPIFLAFSGGPTILDANPVPKWRLPVAFQLAPIQLSVEFLEQRLLQPWVVEWMREAVGAVRLPRWKGLSQQEG